ncbi:MAG: hypothetical protein KGD63_11640 [Candidatus Lokiarchaeota archaeon]|nr:hypothetical protein [Candidatus Lokiarchaeota archaeon]
MKQNKEKPKEDYHSIAPISNIVKQMKKHYDKNPKDWKVTSSNDKDYNTDTFINKKPYTYWIKSKQLNPFSAISMGTVVKNIDKEIDENIYGKQMSKEDMLKVFGMVVPIKKDKNIITTGIENFSQKKGDHFKQIIKEIDSNVGYKMARKIDDAFTKNFPQRKNLYI